MRASGYWAAALIGLLVAACDSGGQAPTGGSGDPGDTGEGGAGNGGHGAGGEAGGAGGETGGAGGGAGQGGSQPASLEVCPLDSIGKDRVDVIGSMSVAASAWILSQTHGHGLFASRAFGAQVPFTFAVPMYKVSLAEECTGPKLFDPYCESGGVPSAPSMSRCVQLECDEHGELTVELWMGGLPAMLPADPPPGEVEVKLFAHSTHYVEAPGLTVDMRWNGRVELVTPDGAALTWNQHGMGSNGAALVAGTMDDTIDGLAPMAVRIVGEVGEDGAAGEIQYTGVAIGTFDHDGLTWLAPCAP